MADQHTYPNLELAQRVAAEMQLGQKECTEMLSSGRAIYRDRIGWACTYLKKAGLLESVKRGHLRITAEGLRIWESHPAPCRTRELPRDCLSLRQGFPTPQKNLPKNSILYWLTEIA